MITKDSDPNKALASPIHVSFLDIAILFAIGALFAALFALDSAPSSALQIFGAGAWGMFFAYVFLASVKRNSSTKHWGLSDVVHLGVIAILRFFGSFGIFYGSRVESDHSILRFLMLGVVGVAMAIFFRLIVVVSRRLKVR